MEAKTSWMLETAKLRWQQQRGLTKPIAATFKQQSVNKDISKLKDDAGDVKTTWEDIIQIARRHFVNLVGTTTEPTEEDLQRVLEAQTDKISEEAAQIMEKPITLEELHYAASRLAKNKVPGRDRIPMEFYLAVWDQVGPIVLEVL